MHPPWSRHSTRLIQISQPPKFMRRGPCSISFLILLHTEPFCLNMFFRVTIFLFFIYIQVLGTLFTSPSLLLPPLPSPSSCPPLLTPMLIPLSLPLLLEHCCHHNT